MVKQRKVPLRICVGCREKKAKRDLVRIVRTPDGEVVFDSTGKKAGRGAYICPLQACLEKAARGRRLEKNLQAPVSEALLTELQAMLAGATHDGG